MNFFIGHWAQVSFTLLAIGYVVKVILESIFKKREIRFNYFLNNRMKSIETFLLNYANLESSFKDASTSYINKILTTKEIDAIIVPLRYRFTDSLATLQLYTTSKEYESFNEIYDKFMMLINECSRLKYKAGLNDVERGNELYFLLQKNQVNNKKLLNEIVNQIQKDIR